MLEHVRHIAIVGGTEALRAYGAESLAARRKGDGTWVTAADESAERTMRELIAVRFPTHNVHGEEEGLTSADGGEPDEGSPTWILDPIDGTHNFMAGVPIWATLVGLEIDGELVAGAVHAPALHETYDAARGLGARMNGESIGVSVVSSLSEGMFVATGYESFEEHGLGASYIEVTRRTARSRGLGDFWGHMLVARGAAEMMAEPILSTWDYSALVPIVEEAGGRITQLDGARLAHGGSCLTTNGKLHDDALEIFAG